MFRLLPLLALAVLLPTAAIAQVGDHYALLVGVQDYDGKTLSKLRYARGDMLKFAALLKRNGVRETNIVVMHDDVRNLQSFRHLADAVKIRRQLDLLLAGLGPADSVIVAFSGHGVQRKGESENYFCPLDADLQDLLKAPPERKSLVSLSEVYARLGKCKAGRKLLLADACRNQPLPGDLLPKAAGDRKVIDLDRVASFSRQTAPAGKGIVGLFSCAPGQQSFEDGGLQQGVFFHHVLKAWQNGTAGADGRLDLLELALSVRSQTSAYARRLNRIQTPQLRGDITGQWLLPLAAGLKAGDIKTGSLGMQLAYIPAGEFLMGSPPAENERTEFETQHRVKLTRPFYLGTHEVTQKQWATVMDAQPWQEKTHVKQGANYPATFISWDDAVKFCAALTRRDRDAGRITKGQFYRLPTEAEWEHACRAGSVTAYSFGSDMAKIDGFGWTGAIYGAANTKSENHPQPVGLKKANAWGLYDMHGNVYEWCFDWFGLNSKAAAIDPQGPDNGTLRVLRGGSWDDRARNARSANRTGAASTERSSSLGFRVVLSPVVSDN